ncbi:hypothetical protein L211DRAFT_884765 [Terfezia boudieri ATCC MYA-4762]|uniref:Uncharacterized protein n=1 Tax=Terfezia boudieri ATCC MYA-4762 TaxID=1051890 RepID=A0A3N4LL60_9PEZI|nr:hypothetical protein L211DRAFT_884765 [Terfezia boudieri ATCC MYA-4762]
MQCILKISTPRVHTFGISRLQRPPGSSPGSSLCDLGLEPARLVPRPTREVPRYPHMPPPTFLCSPPPSQNDSLNYLISQTWSGLCAVRNRLTEQGLHNIVRWGYYTIGALAEIELNLKVALGGVPVEFRNGSRRYEREHLIPGVLLTHSQPPPPKSPPPILPPLCDSGTQTTPPTTSSTAEAETQSPAPKTITRNSVSTNTEGPPART